MKRTMDGDREDGQPAIRNFFKRVPRPSSSTTQLGQEANPSTSDSEPRRPTYLPRLPRTDMDPNDREDLVAIADETIKLWSQLDPALADQAAQSNSYTLESLPRLNPSRCPGHKPTLVRVLNRDTLTAAVKLGELYNIKPGTGEAFPLVMNFANQKTPGGGWRDGAWAQEEALCYRSTLGLSLDNAQYPLADREVLYNPNVVVLREERANGHGILPEAKRSFVSAVTAVALYHPSVMEFMLGDGTKKVVYAQDRKRVWTKDKMRLALRIAATHRHELLVLGAFGCGVFRNPVEDVAWCWKEVLGEHEFSGGWWKEVWFAIYDKEATPAQDSNLVTFEKVFDGYEF